MQLVVLQNQVSVYLSNCNIIYYPSNSITVIDLQSY